MILKEQIDAILPQTQCTLCGFDGCMPYAEALAEKRAAINLCPPGGVKGLLALGTLLNQDPTPYISEMEKIAKPKKVAKIREAECIGCVKCIPPCPVDAIVGSAKQLHTVIIDLCTGCELCIAPCPVDCIEMVDSIELSTEEEKLKADLWRKRYQAHKNRLQKEWIEKSEGRKPISVNLITQRKTYIHEALERVKTKKSLCL